MNDVLKDLYYGRIAPSEAPASYEYRAALKKVIKLEEKLLEDLSPDLKKTFLEFCDVSSQLSSVDAFDNFKAGFKLGAKITLESLFEPEK